MNLPKSFPAPADPQLLALSERHSWISLENLPEVEAWINLQQDELHSLITATELQAGVYFQMQPEGEVFLYTNQDGDISLELSLTAEWLQALLAAIYPQAKHLGRIWHFPADCLVTLIWGLNSLILHSQLVIRKSKREARV